MINLKFIEPLCYNYMKTKGCRICDNNSSKSQANIIFLHIFYARELINSNFNNKTKKYRKIHTSHNSKL